jgi:hypothetical protein
MVMDAALSFDTGVTTIAGTNGPSVPEDEDEERGED